MNNPQAKVGVRTAIRITCPDAVAMQNVLDVLEAAFGAPKHIKTNQSPFEGAGQATGVWMVSCAPHNEMTDLEQMLNGNVEPSQESEPPRTVSCPIQFTAGAGGGGADFFINRVVVRQFPDGDNDALIASAKTAIEELAAEALLAVHAPGGVPNGGHPTIVHYGYVDLASIKNAARFGRTVLFLWALHHRDDTTTRTMKNHPRGRFMCNTCLV